MWEIIKKLRGIPPDQHDQALGAMISRTLANEIIPFDEWQNLVDDLEDEAEDALDTKAILRDYGLTLPELVGQAEAARKEFLDALHRCGLPLDDRLKLCQVLFEKASEEPSAELLRLYCDIVCDNGFLLDIERAGDDGAVCWLSGREDADALYDYLSERAQENQRVRKILEAAKQIHLSNLNFGTDTSSRAEETFQAYIQIFKPVRNQEKLLDNITHLLQLADHTAELAPIKPLFLYRMLTRHKKRMQTNEALNVDLRALWNYREYNFEQNNGKNIPTNARYLKLFSRLCDIFQSDKAVDIPLCICGFEQLSNLSEFYRIYAPEDFEILFAIPIEELLDNSLFSCFERGYEDNVVMASGEISPKALDRFQCSADRNCARALARILNYMNEHIQDAVERFWGAAPEEVKALCAEILQASDLPNSQQPRTPQDTALFLAAINGGLMEAVDEFAMQYLIAAGKLLIYE